MLQLRCCFCRASALVMGLLFTPRHAPERQRHELVASVQSFMCCHGLGGQITGHGENIGRLKTLIVVADGQVLAVVLPAPTRLDFQKLSLHVCVPPAQVCLAARSDVQTMCGFPIGSVPPFGHRPPLRILVDPAGQVGEVSGGCGDPAFELKTSWAEILRSPRSEPADLTSVCLEHVTSDDSRARFEDRKGTRAGKAGNRSCCERLPRERANEPSGTSTAVYSVPTQYVASALKGMKATLSALNWTAEGSCHRMDVFDRWIFTRGSAIVRIDVYDDKLGNTWPLARSELAASFWPLQERGQRCAKGSQKGFRSMVIHDVDGFQAAVHALLYSWWAVLKRPDLEAPLASLTSCAPSASAYFGTCTWEPPTRTSAARAGSQAKSCAQEDGTLRTDDAFKDSLGHAVSPWDWLTEEGWVQGFKETPTTPVWMETGALPVTVEGLVLRCRRQARLLVFITFSECSGLPPVVQGMPLQAVVGRDFAAFSGEERAVECFKCIRQGARVRVAGYIQLNPRGTVDLAGCSSVTITDQPSLAPHPGMTDQESAQWQNKPNKTRKPDTKMRPPDQADLQKQQVLAAAPLLELRVPVTEVATPVAVAQVVAAIAFSPVAAIDCEWRPRATGHPVAVLQVALFHHVYVIDCVTLSRPALLNTDGNRRLEGFSETCPSNVTHEPPLLADGADPVSTLLLALFDSPCQPKIVLGFGPSDIPRLAQAFPSAAAALDAPSNFVDLQQRFSGRHCVGLSQVCTSILGHRLDKTEQQSDWEQRPLSDAQITYAALDSHCLLLLYEHLGDTCNAENSGRTCK